ncbi:hypothetical protein P154DRAFT_428809 [Amniculicola lignicola CBS 123094]|uniref:Stress-associated endoplasmic reticulum protein n=1 Tax=Amniculicola lignicola CBS 123094 TaxID=1392246 RepID=A0A6A5WPL0_9PLEO|nr:hypothetical protein P154DRAFT_428809 [Amniculicola lignicola CBS 123094]
MPFPPIDDRVSPQASPSAINVLTEAVLQAQTPQQRAANAKFARREEAKMGKPPTTVTKKQSFKSPISKGWIIVLAFVLCGGVIFEVLRMFF